MVEKMNILLLGIALECTMYLNIYLSHFHVHMLKYLLDLLSRIKHKTIYFP